MSEVLTRTGETEAAYARRARQLIARLSLRMASEHQRAWRPGDLVSYLEQLRPTLAHASWRQYKAAVVWFARQQPASDHAWLGIADQLASLGWSGQKRAQSPPKRTSARKLKDVSASDLIRLRDHFSFVDPLAAAFVTAAWTTGLRPTEWTNAKLDTSSDPWCLEVTNAKRTNGRSHGVNRTLWFNIPDFKTINALQKIITTFGEASSQKEVDALKERFERAFREANHVLWPHRKMKITPYTLRHACGARLKQTYSPAEVAALMGHRSDVTAFTHYGRFIEAKGGGLPQLPKADPAEVKRVKLVKDARLKTLKKTKAKAMVQQQMTPIGDIQDEAPGSSGPRL